MRETELANLLIRMAADRGIEVEQAAEELALIALPSFVDSRAFRSAVIQALETHLRAQVEERVQSIRRRFDMEPQQPWVAQPGQVVVPPVVAPKIDPHGVPSAMDGMPEPVDGTMSELTSLTPAAAADNAEPDEELPADATMVWTTRHG